MHDLGHTEPLFTATALRLEGGRATSVADVLAEETPVTLSYNGASHAVMMATPADLEDFALGFSITEGLVSDAAQLTSIGIVRYSRGIELQIETVADVIVDTSSRRLSGRTGCGLCGKADVEQVLRAVPRVRATTLFTATAITRAISGLTRAQPLNAASGAIHAAAWAHSDGTVGVAREDVGRHNALDKVVGAMARTGLDARQGFIVLTSRGSFELVQKAAMLGVGLVATVSAPTALAVRMAEDAGITLAGFARDARVTIYSHADRVIDAATCAGEQNV